MVGIPETFERYRLFLVFLRLLVGDGSDEFGGDTIATGDFTGDLRLIHGLWGAESLEKYEQITEGQGDQNQKKQDPADQDACIELVLWVAHAGLGNILCRRKFKALVP